MLFRRCPGVNPAAQPSRHWPHKAPRLPASCRRCRMWLRSCTPLYSSSVARAPPSSVTALNAATNDCSSSASVSDDPSSLKPALLETRRPLRKPASASAGGSAAQDGGGRRTAACAAASCRRCSTAALPVPPSPDGEGEEASPLAGLPRSGRVRLPSSPLPAVVPAPLEVAAAGCRPVATAEEGTDLLPETSSTAAAWTAGRAEPVASPPAAAGRKQPLLRLPLPAPRRGCGVMPPLVPSRCVDVGLSGTPAEVACLRCRNEGVYGNSPRRPPCGAASCPTPEPCW